MSINYIIIDDEISCIRSLQWLIERANKDFNLVKSYQNGTVFLEEIEELSIDVAFLDIEMPHIRGPEIAKQCILHNIKVVFCTAFQDFILSALRMSAIDYLLKPVNNIELTECLDRIISLPKDNQTGQIDVLNSSLNEAPNNKIIISTTREVFVLEKEDVLYCQAYGNYVQYHCTNGKRHVVSNTLKLVETQLANMNFIRSHQSYLVNQQHIFKVVKSDPASIVLSNKEQIPISRRNKKEVLKSI